FVETDVIMSYIKGDPWASQLFSDEEMARVRLTVNAIVLQDMFFTESIKEPAFERIADHLEIIDLVFDKVEKTIARLPGAVYKPGVHSNDLLVMSSAEDCDYLITRKPHMKDLAIPGKPTVLTPEEFVNLRKAA